MFTQRLKVYLWTFFLFAFTSHIVYAIPRLNKLSDGDSVENRFEYEPNITTKFKRNFGHRFDWNRPNSEQLHFPARRKFNEFRYHRRQHPYFRWNKPGKFDDVERFYDRSDMEMQKRAMKFRMRPGFTKKIDNEEFAHKKLHPRGYRMRLLSEERQRSYGPNEPNEVKPQESVKLEDNYVKVSAPHPQNMALLRELENPESDIEEENKNIEARKLLLETQENNNEDEKSLKPLGMSEWPKAVVDADEIGNMLNEPSGSRLLKSPRKNERWSPINEKNKKHNLENRKSNPSLYKEKMDHLTGKKHEKNFMENKRKLVTGSNLEEQQPEPQILLTKETNSMPNDDVTFVAGFGHSKSKDKENPKRINEWNDEVRAFEGPFENSGQRGEEKMRPDNLDIEHSFERFKKQKINMAEQFHDYRGKAKFPFNPSDEFVIHDFHAPKMKPENSMYHAHWHSRFPHFHRAHEPLNYKPPNHYIDDFPVYPQSQLLFDQHLHEEGPQLARGFNHRQQPSSILNPTALSHTPKLDEDSTTILESIAIPLTFNVDDPTTNGCPKRNCSTTCHGNLHKLDTISGCPLCACCPSINCTKVCTFGYEANQEGCPTCECLKLMK